MAWIDNFMPGETGGLPDGGYGSVPAQTGFQGLLSGNNALFNIGMGILANNTGHYGAFGPAVGQGVQQGISNTQRATQMAQQKQIQDYQVQEYTRKQQEYERQQKALEDFKTKFPDYAAAVDLNPALAIKAAYPNLAANSADPYFTPIPTASGLGSFNNRTGGFVIVQDANGNPIVKSSDSPEVRGAVKSAEARATAAYKPNTDIPGLLSTDEAIARAVYGNNPIPFQAPQMSAPQLPQSSPQTAPVTPQSNVSGNFSGNPQAILSQINRISDPQERANATAAYNQQYGQQPQQVPAPYSPNIGGIKVPTPTELAVQKKVAEMNAESAAKKENTMAGVGSVIDQARGILTGKVKPTSSGFGNLEDAAGALVGYAPQGAAEADALKAVAGQLVSKMPRMEGPQSNFDVQNYQQMAGDVGNATIPIERRLKALSAMEQIVRKYDKTSAQPTNNQPSAQPLPAKPSTLTLKKGQVYATPKGNLTWNGKAFED